MIKCSIPSITDLEKQYVYTALSNNDIGIGEYVGKFEKKWSSWNNMKYGVACNSGTNAIYLALKALGIKKGDEVLVPEYTMIATAWAVTYTGAKPVFVDCDDFLNMDPTKIKQAVTKKTKAIIVVPIYGRVPQQRVYTLANSLGLDIVEDMAEAHGITPQGCIACYSFYGNKIITTGEGGMCITNNEKYAEEMRLLANMYFDKERKMLHPKVGHNFRMTNIQAAIGLAQAERIDEILAKRKQIEQWYDKYLPEKLKMPPRNVVWMYDIQTDDQEGLKAKLEQNGVESRYGFKPMSRQKMYLDNYEHLNAHKWSKRILYLPTYPDLTEKDIKKICKIIKS